MESDDWIDLRYPCHKHIGTAVVGIPAIVLIMFLIGADYFPSDIIDTHLTKRSWIIFQHDSRQEVGQIHQPRIFCNILRPELF